MAIHIKEMFKGFDLFKSKNNVLGIDIGSSSIKLVQLKKEKERGILDTYGEISLGQYGNMNVGQAVRLSEDKIVEALNDIIKESNAKSRTASVSIPLRSSFVAVMDLPDVPERKLDEVVKLEARRYVPISISEVLLDWWLIPKSLDEKENIEEEEKDGKKGKDSKRVLLVAIHRDTISSYKEIFSKAGIEIASFEIEIFSMIRACAGRTNQPVVVVDFGAATTKIVIVDYGIIRVSHSISKGSQDLTTILSRSLGVDFSKAEEVKREIGLSPLPEHKEIKSLMEPELEFVISEINKIIKDYQRKYNRAVSKVIFIGGGSLLKGLIDFSVKGFNTEVNLANPFAKVEYPAFLNDVLQEVGASFAISLGLAIREL